MENKSIISICYVSSKNDKTTQLCRIADYIHGKYVPYAFDPSRDFNGDDRDLLVGLNYELLAEVGEIGVFEWYAYLNVDNKWWTNVKRYSEVSWCEVLYLDYVESPAMMVKNLKKGIRLESFFDGKHDLILVSRKDASGKNAVMARKGTLKCRENLICFSNDVMSVPVGYVDLRSDTGSCQCRYAQAETRRFLRNLDDFKAQGKIKVKDPAEAVSDIVLGNMAFFDSGVLSRREKQLLRGAMEKVTNPGIVDLVTGKIGCSPEEAKEYIQEYIETAERKLDQYTALSFIEKLVENDADAVKKMEEIVREKWAKENEAIIADKKTEIQRFSEVLLTAQKEAEEERRIAENQVRVKEEKLARLTKEADDLKDSIANLQKLQEDLEKAVLERLKKAKEDLAGSMLDRLMMLPASLEQTVGEEKKKGYTIISHSEETEKVSAFECHDVAQTGWERICGDKDMSAGLALLAMAAFTCNRALLVAGDGAETIAEMLSVSVSGKLPLKIHLDDHANLEQLISDTEKEDHRIICVMNGLEFGYTAARELMERFRDSRFIFTAMHGESLEMEPSSLFYTFFPILTDYFYNGRHVQEYPTFNCTEELLILRNSDKEKVAFREAKRRVWKWLKDDFFPPMFKFRAAKLVASMIMLAREMNIDESILRTTEIEFVLVPCLKCMKRKEKLQNILLEETNLEEYKKTDLLRYLGVEGI